jgi:AhpD family alkylhydroperoxidase
MDPEIASHRLNDRKDYPMTSARNQERQARAAEAPIVGDLPDFPGILAAIMISPDLAAPLRDLADALLVRHYLNSTVTRAERELIATAVSAGNDCFYCMDTHGSFAATLLERGGYSTAKAARLVDELKESSHAELPLKLRRLIDISLQVRKNARGLSADAVASAQAAGATPQDVHLAVLIAAAFCMYNRIVDGFRARTPTDITAYRERAEQIADFGYADQRVSAVPVLAEA